MWNKEKNKQQYDCNPFHVEVNFKVPTFAHSSHITVLVNSPIKIWFMKFIFTPSLPYAAKMILFNTKKTCQPST